MLLIVDSIPRVGPVWHYILSVIRSLSSQTNTPTSAEFLATQISTVTAQGPLADSSASSSVTNSVEVGQPVVTDAAVALGRGS